MVDRLLKFLTSLKLTVVCLALSLILVFIGTLAQVDEGLYLVQDRYFKSFLIYLEPAGANWRIPVFPGGYAVGLVLLVNLLAAHAQRFTFSKKKAGIFLIHAGLILLILGQVFTDVFSRESALEFEEGQSMSYSVDFRKNELVLVDGSASDTDTVISIPESRLRNGASIEGDTLPFRIQVHDYWSNSDVSTQKTESAIATKATEGPAKDFFVIPMAPVTEMDRRDIPSGVVELFDGDQSIGTWLVSAFLRPQTVSVGDKDYELALRHRRYYEPFSLTLLKATHEQYKGTTLPKNFSSRVRLQNPNTSEDREVLIYMNHPLRYGGLTFYQYQMLAAEAAAEAGATPRSTLQVVHNPTYLTPYLSCFMVGAGMLVQFLMHLVGFLKKHRKKRAQAGEETPAKPSRQMERKQQRDAKRTQDANSADNNPTSTSESPAEIVTSSSEGKSS